MKIIFTKLCLLFILISCTYHGYEKVTDVYLGGYSWKTGHGRWGKIWKNGDTTDIGGVNSKIVINSIAVNGGDVYSTGNEFASVRVAKYWKNGLAVTLAKGDTAEGNFIAVAGDDVYVVGLGPNNNVMFWKNSVLIPLEDDPVQINGMATSGIDIYLLGVSDKYKSAYWKNGRVNYLESGSFPSSIAVSGTDVYIGGYNGGSVGYWKNGVFNGLEKLFNVAGINTFIAINGNDIYLLADWTYSGICYGCDGRPILWKNGVSKLVNEINEPTGLAVDANGGVHIIGQNGYGYSAYWKDGLTTQISENNVNGSSVVTSIALGARMVEK